MDKKRWTLPAQLLIDADADAITARCTPKKDFDYYACREGQAIEKQLDDEAKDRKWLQAGKSV